MNNNRRKLLLSGGLLLTGAGLACLLLHLEAVLRPGLPSESTLSPWLPAGLLLLAAGGGLLIFLYQEVHRRERRGRETPRPLQSQAPKVPPEGYLTAVIIGISRNLRNPGEPEAYHVICKYTEPDTGREYTYASEALPAYPGKELIGRSARVYLDPREPGNYRVVLPKHGGGFRSDSRHTDCF